MLEKFRASMDPADLATMIPHSGDVGFVPDVKRLLDEAMAADDEGNTAQTNIEHFIEEKKKSIRGEMERLQKHLVTECERYESKVTDGRVEREDLRAQTDAIDGLIAQEHIRLKMKTSKP